MAVALEVIAGSGGFKVVSDTTAETGVEYNSIVVMADAVFSAFDIDGVNVLVAKGLQTSLGGTVTIKSGSFLPAGTNGKITAFTLASGSVIAYK